MKHTPAPWKAGARSVSAPETEDRLGLDCRLYGGNAGDNRANARLIAASPDLLAALRRLIAALDAHATVHAADGDDVARMLEYAQAEDAARAAIAKATGAPA